MYIKLKESGKLLTQNYYYYINFLLTNDYIITREAEVKIVVSGIIVALNKGINLLNK